MLSKQSDIKSVGKAALLLCRLGWLSGWRQKEMCHLRGGNKTSFFFVRQKKNIATINRRALLLIIKPDSNRILPEGH
jgi:hypothetical protein